MATTFNTGNHILVGLGGTGGKVLRAFKMRMFEEFTPEERAKKAVALVYVDSTDEMMPQGGRPRPDFRVMGQDASFTKNEFLNIKSIEVSAILDHPQNYPQVKGIIENAEAVRRAIGSLGQAAGQKRRAGRLLFAANAQAYVNSIKDAFARCQDISGETNELYIHIFAGLAGGTGSGSIIDALVQTRKTFPKANITVYAMIPEMYLPHSGIDQGRYYQNGYAALMELNALQSGVFMPQDVTGTGPINVFSEAAKGVANGLMLYSNVNENGQTLESFSELPKTVSDFVFARIFLVNNEDEVNGDMVRGFKYENMDDFCFEYDENGKPDANGKIPIARTKKINSFGIKRVMYPELRILKHITYTVGEDILYQFKFNNWRENQGFVNEERNKDYRQEYFSAENLSNWMLDIDHLTLNKKVLPDDPDHPSFKEYWDDKAIGYAEEAKSADCPLNELQNTLQDFYALHFREVGVEPYFAGKERAIPELAKEIRHKIEKELFEKWHVGDISIVELQKVSKLLIERMTEIRKELEKESKEELDNFNAIEEDRQFNLTDWSNLGILQRMVNKGARLYAEHQTILGDLFTSKTRMVALEFAKKLAAKLALEINDMDADIGDFGKLVSDAIDETEKLITAQRKINKGLEDMRGAIIEVCEEEAMSAFERDVKVDKITMPAISLQLRNEILPEGDFISFNRLTNSISIEDIRDAFDRKLADIIRQKHSERIEADKKVLGMNILTQLRQKLTSDDEIKAFAHTIIKQSGVYLQLNPSQLQLHLRNNEGALSPTNPASYEKKTILVSIPSPEGDAGLVKFADKLEQALLAEIGLGEKVSIKVNRKSPRKDELSVLTLKYCFPMRAIDWLADYSQRYDRMINTGNPGTDAQNATLLHGEGNGKNLPSIFPVDKPQEVQEPVITIPTDPQPPVGGPQPPVAPGQPTVGPGMPPPPQQLPTINVFLSINGQQYGPYDAATCKQLVTNGQMTKQTYVWMDGMPSWQLAEQVPALSFLFAPAMPPATPGMPPMPPAAPGVPPMPGM